MLRAALALAVVGTLATLAAPAAANGRNPGTSTIHFRVGHESDIVAGMTFGLIVSHDAGATWQWMCEDAIGYGGIFDPVYAYAPSGTLFATTFAGLKASRDGCTFSDEPSGAVFVSTDSVGSDGTFYYGASQPSDANIYKSTDDGVTFGSAVTPPGGMPNDSWQSIAIAPSDPQRIYLFGHRFNKDGHAAFLLYKSIDAGASYTAISTTGFVTSDNSTIEVVGIDKTNPDVVYAHASAQDKMTQHGLYRSDDAGTTWTPLFTISDLAFAFVARANGDLLVGTPLSGVFLSHDRGATWAPVSTAPHINCLVENAAGEVWACTQNYSVMGGPPTDGAGIMKSTDAVHWTAVMKYQDIVSPVSCAAGTVQHDTCEVGTWCGLKAQLGITSTALACAGPEAPPAHDAPVTAGKGGSCCDTGGDGGWLAGLGLALGWWRRPARGKHRRNAC